MNLANHVNTFGQALLRRYGERVHKIAIDAGFTCPNRDGSIGKGGCTFCNNVSFSPNGHKPNLIAEQIDSGRQVIRKRTGAKKYIAYFQAYTNTYAELDALKKLYKEALDVSGVIGLVIGTRPDCISEELIEYLSLLAKNYYISLEFGVESTLNKTLLKVNRCHTFEDTIHAYKLCKNKGIDLGAHLIIGLPGESRQELLEHAKRISKLPIQTLKLHHLQIVKNSIMAVQHKRNPEDFNLFTAETYIDFISEFITYVHPDIIIERFISEAPLDLLIAPKWNGLKNFEIVAKIDKNLTNKNLWQGKNYNS